MTDALTLDVFVLLLALGAAFDIWTLVIRGYATTISWNLLQVSKKWPIIAFLLGVLLGHVFWPNAAGMCP